MAITVHEPLSSKQFSYAIKWGSISSGPELPCNYVEHLVEPFLRHNLNSRLNKLSNYKASWKINGNHHNQFRQLIIAAY